MLYRYCDLFLQYIKVADFSKRSVQAASSRINEFKNFLALNNIKSIKKVTYKHLFEFAGAYQTPSIHVTKSRVWTLRQFYHYLSLQV